MSVRLDFCWQFASQNFYWLLSILHFSTREVMQSYSKQHWDVKARRWCCLMWNNVLCGGFSILVEFSIRPKSHIIWYKVFMINLFCWNKNSVLYCGNRQHSHLNKCQFSEFLHKHVLLYCILNISTRTERIRTWKVCASTILWGILCFELKGLCILFWMFLCYHLPTVSGQVIFIQII